MKNSIEQFFSSQTYAVIGASNNRQKFGNKVLRSFLQHFMSVYPVNPHEDFIEGLFCLKQISELPPTVKSITIITPPEITEKIVDEAIKKGIKNIWIQPGAESETAIYHCLKHKINLIANGPCILVELGFTE
ncbi:MAG: CoA-binding protein [Tatlockia sp.]|nr:CoA-binding protein [Tatlockia sp.]